MSNFISFSLFGTHPMYLHGMIRNAQLAREVYPGWKVVCYCDIDVPSKLIDQLRALKVDVRAGDPDVKNQMFWRLLIAEEPTMTRFIVRDCDSRLSVRERSAVDDWIHSELQFHVMGDHIHHWLPVGGGLFGAVKGALKPIKEMIVRSGLAKVPYRRENGYNLDQIFLANYVLPQVSGRVLRHDSCCRKLYPWAKPFPNGCHFNDMSFVGEIIDEREQPNWHHRQQRVNFMTPA